MKQVLGHLPRLISTISLAAALLCAAAARADEAEPTVAVERRTDDGPESTETDAPQAAESDAGAEYGEPIHSGFVVVAGRPVDAPYRVGHVGRDVFINGRRVAVVPRAESESRKKKSGGLSEKTQKAVQTLVARIERQLYRDMTLLVFDDSTRLVLDNTMSIDLLNQLIQVESPQERLQVVMTLFYDGYESDYGVRGNESITTAQWRRALAAFEPHEELRQYVRDQLAFDSEEVDAEAPVAIFRNPKAQRTYLLTVVGMLLVVVSAGILLSHRPETTGAWSNIVEGAAEVRLIRDCVALIVVLSLFDLFCTLLANAGGGFEELNPLAHSWVPNPTVLIAFKLSATAAGVGILLWLRKYTGAQLASWWLCLLLTVLTVRWIAVQSLLLA